MSQNNPLTALIDAKPFILLDGAMATELEARGCNLADSLWSAKVLVDNPELIREVRLFPRRRAGGDHRQLSGHSGRFCCPRP